jgi:hypothetical protein
MDTNDSRLCTDSGFSAVEDAAFDLWAQLPPSINATASKAPVLPGCPLLSVVYGRVVSFNQTKDINMLLCRPYIEQVDVEVVFTLLQYTLDVSRPPRAKPNTGKIILTEFLTAIADDQFAVEPVVPLYPGASGLDFLSVNGSEMYLQPWF